MLNRYYGHYDHRPPCYTYLVIKLPKEIFHVYLVVNLVGCIFNINLLISLSILFAHEWTKKVRVIFSLINWSWLALLLALDHHRSCPKTNCADIYLNWEIESDPTSNHQLGLKRSIAPYNWWYHLFLEEFLATK